MINTKVERFALLMLLSSTTVGVKATLFHMIHFYTDCKPALDEYNAEKDQLNKNDTFTQVQNPIYTPCGFNMNRVLSLISSA